ncbi:MAG: tetratricopeptide repeat protein, partial [Deltaproteobacteria bacterium]|nr:tetratricopeptide repeat protein [Deltaproteobacteria bacterium]
RFLLANGRIDQGMMEFRLAADRDVRYVEYGAMILARRVADVKMLMSWPIHPEQKSLYFDALSRHLARIGRNDDAATLDARNAALPHPAPDALLRQANRLAFVDTAQAMALAEQLNAIEGHQKDALLLRAKIHQRRGNREKALAVLTTAPKDIANTPEVLRMLATLYLEVKRVDDALATAHRLYRQAVSVADRVSAVCFEGDLQMRAGRYHSALASYKQALAMVPYDTRVMKKILDAAQRAKDFQLSRDMRMRLGVSEPSPVK